MTRSTAGVLNALRIPLVRLLAAGQGALAVGLAMLALGAAAWAFRLGLMRDGAWAFLAWVGALGLAAAVVRGGDVESAAVAGVRRLGLPDRIELDDRFHIASRCATAAKHVIVIHAGSGPPRPRPASQR